MKNKHILQFVAILLCTTLLTFSVGRVTRVKAVVTEAAIVTGVAIIVGTAFLGYLALSGATVRYDNIDTLNDYVADVGNWVMEYGSGVGLTRLIAQASDWVGRQALNALDFTVEYTSELISDFYNSFNNKDIISKIAVEVPPSILIPTLSYPYPSAQYTNLDLTPPTRTGFDFVYEIMSGYSLYLIASPTTSNSLSGFYPYQLPYDNLVNYQISGSSTFYIGTLIGNHITNINPRNLRGSGPYVGYQNGVITNYSNWSAYSMLAWSSLASIYTSYANLVFPFLANKPLYLVDSNNDIIAVNGSVATTSSTSVSYPNNGSDDYDRNPIIPFVPFPNSPTNPNGFWGSLIRDILDAIEDGLDIAILSELLNAFAAENGGDSILYDDDIINYYYSYDIKNNITQRSEELPIDLNEISLYTDNRYLTTLTDSVDSVSDVIHDYVGFWYDVDPTVVIVILGSAILSVVSLLLHKMGG